MAAKLTTAHSLGSLAAYNDTTTTSRRTNQTRRITDQIALGSRIPQQRLTIRNLKPHTSLDSLGHSLEFEMVA
jgi:hypothetical protein